jgi:hypothetical protein
VQQLSRHRLCGIATQMGEKPALVDGQIDFQPLVFRADAVYDSFRFDKLAV